MDKSRLREAIVAQLLTELDVLTRAALMARDEATNEESKAENKYDMRAQEAAYLAESQARLAAELQETIRAYQTLPFNSADAHQPIGVGAVITLEANDRRAFYFLGPSRGGIGVEVDGQAIIVITPSSPLGRQLLGRRLGDTAQLPGRGGSIAHRISAIE